MSRRTTCLPKRKAVADLVRIARFVETSSAQARSLVRALTSTDTSLASLKMHLFTLQRLIKDNGSNSSSGGEGGFIEQFLSLDGPRAVIERLHGLAGNSLAVRFPCLYLMAVAPYAERPASLFSYS